MEIYSKTDIGQRRKQNQDSTKYKILSPSCVWAIVCDGMGGMNGGMEASNLAVEYISDYLDKKFSEKTQKKDIPALMISAVEEANVEIIKKAKENIELTGMGTTCEFVIVRDESVYIIHIGDSRIYSVRGGKILQLTEDHSVVQEMVKRGEITQEQADNHPNKNFITRALGISKNVHLDYIEADFKYGDVILLCSDGLTNYVTVENMVIMAADTRLEEYVGKLVDTANSNGGGDNITVVAAAV